VAKQSIEVGTSIVQPPAINFPLESARVYLRQSASRLNHLVVSAKMLAERRVAPTGQ